MPPYLYRYTIEIEGNGVVGEYFSNIAPPRVGEEIDINMLERYTKNRDALLDAGLCEVVTVHNHPTEFTEIEDDNSPICEQVAITLVIKTKKVTVIKSPSDEGL